ncbi:MAG: hypothetical protein HY695_06885 [Deltaproteobacteria bacterium]|nr:hypothetical protein [Deltaproteobacteria bacterium]
MRLELASFPVADVRLGKETSFKNGLLEINKEELLALVLDEKRIASADLAVACPGEQTRIVNIRDVAEPRTKTLGPGCIFPGILGPIETVGEGRTHRLSGVTVMHSAEYEPEVTAGTGAGNSGLVDMSGPGAALTPFGSTINIVLTTKLVGGLTELEAHNVIQLAEFRLAQRLAETTRDMAPENVEVLELFEVDASLPRIVYILGCYSEWHIPHPSVAYYGYPIRESLPTLVHPNELMDGALTTDARKGDGSRPTTWQWMNHAVVLGLLREHGKRLNFLGIILQRTRFETEFGKQMTAASTSQMARLLRANGAIITRMSPSGNNLMDIMLTVQSCEQKGVNTVFLTPEVCDSDGTGLPLQFYVPEASAMVSASNLNAEVRLPAMMNVIGCEEGQFVISRPGAKPISPWSEITLERRTNIADGIDWFGCMQFACVGH